MYYRYVSGSFGVAGRSFGGATCQKAYAGRRVVSCCVLFCCVLPCRGGRDILLWMMTVGAPGYGAKNRLEKSFRRLDMSGRPARVMD